MTVARHYVMTAKDGSEIETLAALKALGGTVAKLPGCQGVELLQDSETATRFIFIEKWDTVEAHKAAAALLPKEALASLMAVLAGRPDGSYLQYHHTT